MEDELLVWIDVECTTLKPKEGVLLEIGAIVTDYDLNEKDQFHELIAHVMPLDNMMDDYVRDMHTKNGLLADLKEIENDGNQLLPRVEKRFGIFLGSLGVEKKNLMPAGNNVQKFDLGWLEEHMPSIPEMMFYRTLDISTLWEAVRVRGKGKRPPKNDAHRVLDDCRESMKLWRTWCELTGL